MARRRQAGSVHLFSGTTAMAHTLGLKVIAEGVEEDEQARHLHLLRCDQFQGYLISRPVPFNQMTSLLRASQAGER
jgi:EAL domain-containing protein (putative c-di-GMP-specific phosphodiesterase class I)